MVPPFSIDGRARPVDYAACMAREIRPILGTLLLLVALAAARDSHAQVSPGGTISDPPAEFIRPVASFDSSPTAHLRGVSADPMDDHLFAVGWWYRITGDLAETSFPTPNAESYASDTSVITWNNVDGRGFRAVETAVVVNGGGPSGQVTLTLNLTNLSDTTPLSIDVFSMADLDLGGTTQADSATLLVPNERIGLTDGSDSAEYGATGAQAFLVLPAENSSGLPDVAGRLNDALVDTFDNTGLPFGPDDFSAGFQWTTTVIPPSGSATFVAGIAVNMALDLPLGSTTTTVTPLSTTTTTLDHELCDNCSDDDGDTLIDFEDTDCCTAAPMTLRKSALRPRSLGVATLKLTAKLATSPVADGSAATQDLTIQLRGADGAFCARVPAGSLSRRRKGLVFRDAGGTLASARGVERITLLEKRRSTKLVVFGSDAQLPSPAPGPLTATLGLRDPATAEAANQCAAATATFRAGKRGVRYP